MEVDSFHHSLEPTAFRSERLVRHPVFRRLGEGPSFLFEGELKLTRKWYGTVTGAETDGEADRSQPFSPLTNHPSAASGPGR